MLGKRVYGENTSDKWDIPWYTTRERCVTILYHVKYSGQHNQCDIRAAHDEKVARNTIECIRAFRHSDWLYFQWHGIKKHMSISGSNTTSQLHGWSALDSALIYLPLLDFIPFAIKSLRSGINLLTSSADRLDDSDCFDAVSSVSICYKQ